MTRTVTPRRVFGQLDSTNAEALRLARSGVRGPLWIDAECQTLGRGRLGRHWMSERGNLLTSYLFAPKAAMENLHQLSLLTGVAVFEAIESLAVNNSDELWLKWPNDIMLGTAKAGGVLVESTTFSDETVVVIGIGLNVAVAPNVSGVATADLRSVLPTTVNLSDLRIRLGETVEEWIGVWSCGDEFTKVRTAWLKKAPKIGTPLTINAGGDVYSGQFAGLDETGSLCLTHPTGEVRCYTFGDVSRTSID